MGELYLKDVLKELEKPGLDPRTTAKAFAFDPNVKTFDDVRVGMILPGIVNNITAFGCFVDIGVKESGLVHISQLKEGYVSDVNEVVKTPPTSASKSYRERRSAQTYFTKYGVVMKIISILAYKRKI